MILYQHDKRIWKCNSEFSDVVQPYLVKHRHNRYAFLHCQVGSVAAWHARQFHRLIWSCLCKTEGVKSPVHHNAGFLGSLLKKVKGYARSLDLFTIICILLNVFIFMNEDTRMQEWVHVRVWATNAINYLQVQKRQHILYFAVHLFFIPTKAS